MIAMEDDVFWGTVIGLAVIGLTVIGLAVRTWVERVVLAWVIDCWGW